MAEKKRRTLRSSRSRSLKSEEVESAKLGTGALKVLVVPETILDETIDQEALVVQLKHPRTGAAALFLLGPDDNGIYELVQFDEGCRSWFLGSIVEKYGTLVFATPVDPLFLLLPYLRKSQNFCPLEDLVMDDRFPDYGRLLSRCSEVNFLSVADIKASGSISAYKYNESKTLLWLQHKAERVAVALWNQRVRVSSGYTSATFVSGRQEDDADKDAYKSYAWDLLKEYLEDDLAQCLPHNISGDSTSPKNKGLPTKKMKTDSPVEPTEDYSSVGNQNSTIARKISKLTCGQKKLLKVDTTGMKNISSFFAKK